MLKALWLIFMFLPVQLKAESLTVAVASNFLPTARKLAQNFEEKSAHKVRFVTGSSGKLFTQIEQGAPFDVFMAADSERPKKLIELKLALSESQYAYANGILAFLGERNHPADLKTWLNQAIGKKLVMANPKTAPYGSAAIQVIRELGMEKQLKPVIIYGNSVAQSFQFIESGNVRLGFVALSTILQEKVDSDRWIVVDSSLYQPIEQVAVVLSVSKKKNVGLAWISFLKEKASVKLIKESGYSVNEKVLM